MYSGTATPVNYVGLESSKDSEEIKSYFKVWVIVDREKFLVST